MFDEMVKVKVDSSLGEIVAECHIVEFSLGEEEDSYSFPPSPYLHWDLHSTTIDGMLVHESQFCPDEWEDILVAIQKKLMYDLTTLHYDLKEEY